MYKINPPDRAKTLGGAKTTMWNILKKNETGKLRDIKIPGRPLEWMSTESYPWQGDKPFHNI